jgi:hypothetical protein
MTRIFKATWRVSIIFLAAFGAPQTATAQQSVWIQIEAQPSLREAEARARDYSAAIGNVAGFALGSGWYGIALGPFTEEDAQVLLRQLRQDRQIPSDSYIADGGSYRRQFWPVGGAAIAAAPSNPAPTLAQPAVGATPAAQPAPPAPLDETPAEARRSERELNREAREDIQIAMQWEGVYTSTIDGDFGPGTRKAMAAWQDMNGHEVTGILTTKQRAALLKGYADVLAALALAPVQDDVAGIALDMPTGMVEFDRYEPPFAHYKAKNGSGVKVVLISQSGDRASLGGLYDIMQTLEIVPLEGERNIGKSSFTLTGTNARIASHTYAALEGGQIKGFSLIWPAGDERRRNMAVKAMEASFTPIEGLLPDVYGETAAQSIDLLSGLEIRSADTTATGFYVDSTGQVLTTAAALDQCSRITLDDSYDAEIVAQNADFALLKPSEALAPMGFAAFQPGIPRLNAEVAVSGYSYGGRLPAPSLTYGALAELKGLDGNEDVIRLALAALPGDAGAPVYDGRGSVLGMLLGQSKGARALPAEVSLAANMASIVRFLSDNGISPAASEGGADLQPEDLIKQATDMTVLVGCWK